ncbi:MAG: DNA replication/repair protein RecF [Hyphomicrobiaceae bacterium]
MSEVRHNACHAARLWVESLTLSNFRNYRYASVSVDHRPVVLVGDNGAGKTNLLEAVSLLAPGQGLRRTAYADLARVGSSGDWAVAARMHSEGTAVDIGTGIQTGAASSGRGGRIVRIDGTAQSGSGALADYVDMVWLTPASDGLFAGPASDRRRFLDRLVLCFDPTYRNRVGNFDRAMRQRNRLLEEGVRDSARFEGFETSMAETGTAIAAARAEFVAAMRVEMDERKQRSPDAVFPWAKVELDGALETALAERPAIDVEDEYRADLARNRERDRAAGRTLSGPHRSDLALHHGPKDMPAKICSTGEQKALLVSLVLAHAELSAARRAGVPPILLLDEIAAHLDADRRSALYADLLRIGTQSWMTGTDLSAFEALGSEATFWRVADGVVTEI